MKRLTFYLKSGATFDLLVESARVATNQGNDLVEFTRRYPPEGDGAEIGLLYIRLDDVSAIVMANVDAAAGDRGRQNGADVEAERS